ncbi:hypothetical protein CERZMDRAFT_101854 [Cercospora zeae-maydis SCOH1-5]|uniref:Uncharacterized protein n=1 Tax=Cercospora zeae-maydis SCOH1-5 TaxID=717836 RepID=A0A6A6F6P8_9PEZI|nr:hypothetical protein CERZMDRAFT_101854 [Cercospora zeae-maydis SCOH1-5]
MLVLVEKLSSLTTAAPPIFLILTSLLMYNIKHVSVSEDPPLFTRPNSPRLITDHLQTSPAVQPGLIYTASKSILDQDYLPARGISTERRSPCIVCIKWLLRPEPASAMEDMKSIPLFGVFLRLRPSRQDNEQFLDMWERARHKSPSTHRRMTRGEKR